jgi:hypothetical protein
VNFGKEMLENTWSHAPIITWPVVKVNNVSEHRMCFATTRLPPTHGMKLTHACTTHHTISSQMQEVFDPYVHNTETGNVFNMLG